MVFVGSSFLFLLFFLCGDCLMKKVLLSKALVFGVVLSLVTQASAFAGAIQFVDGKGKWVSTQCVLPVSPSAFQHDPERPADDLNAKLARHNRYAAEVQNYMHCVSREAQNDTLGVEYGGG